MKKIIKKINGNKKAKIGMIATVVFLFTVMAVSLIWGTSVSAGNIEKTNNSIIKISDNISKDVPYLSEADVTKFKGIMEDQDVAYRNKDIKGLIRIQNRMMVFKEAYTENALKEFAKRINEFKLPENATKKQEAEYKRLISSVVNLKYRNDKTLKEKIDYLEEGIKSIESLIVRVSGIDSDEVKVSIHPVGDPIVIDKPVANPVTPAPKPVAPAPAPAPKPVAPTPVPKPAPVGTMTCYYYVADTHWDSDDIGRTYVFGDKYLRDEAVSIIKSKGYITRSWDKEMPIGSCFKI